MVLGSRKIQLSRGFQALRNLVRFLSQHIFPLFLVSLAPDLAVFRDALVIDLSCLDSRIILLSSAVLHFAEGLSQKDKMVLAFGGLLIPSPLGFLQPAQKKINKYKLTFFFASSLK